MICDLYYLWFLFFLICKIRYASKASSSCANNLLVKGFLKLFIWEYSRYLIKINILNDFRKLIDRARYRENFKNGTRSF